MGRTLGGRGWSVDEVGVRGRLGRERRRGRQAHALGGRRPLVAVVDEPGRVERDGAGRRSVAVLAVHRADRADAPALPALGVRSVLERVVRDGVVLAVRLVVALALALGRRAEIKGEAGVVERRVVVVLVVDLLLDRLLEVENCVRVDAVVIGL